ncbi:STAS domain-containing protein [Pontibacter silvestris]|uniref:STAS domain-containing protein n=1 Tax=Pontibacter silvestris TaxID=2305183 RepID=A0ABW4X0A3_9BACT|nr:STAS domain-containing protein [Pontibacter silvestris]MCC9135924.1 STAS domain-containing protein [Pontibacter silvestris]
MPIVTQKLAESFIVLVYGDLDTEDTKSMRHAFEQAISENHKNLWVDCSSLATISVEAMRMILSYTSKIEAVHINFILYNVCPVVQEKLENSGLNNILKIVPTIKEAYIYCRNRQEV